MNISRKQYEVDATGQVLGRLASDIAKHLIGKTNTNFLSHVDAGDDVVVKNVQSMVVTGKKMAQKVYHHHTGHPGGLRTKTLASLWAESPEKVLRAAVSRMLPKNKHRTARMLRLTIK
jgi:large subunit ribosomal protein L13